MDYGIIGIYFTIFFGMLSIYQIYKTDLGITRAKRRVRSGGCGDKGNNLMWKYDKSAKKLVIEGSGAMAGYEKENTPWAYHKFNSVVFPKGITFIGNYAFSGCTSLKSIDLSNCSALTKIGAGAFENCSLHEEVDLSKCIALERIEERAFYDCKSLTEVKLPSLLKYILDDAFYNCKKLSSINLSDCPALTKIGAGAFENCSLYEEVDLSKCIALERIEERAFYDCKSLTEVKLPGLLKYILDDAFYNCKKLSSINLSDCTSLTSIGNRAFFNCKSLKDVDLSECASLKRIGKNAFCDCSNLTTLDLSQCGALEKIGYGAFCDCKSLKDVDLSGCTSLTSIERCAFYDCETLKDVDLSGCTLLASIGNWAFCDCKVRTFIVERATEPPRIDKTTFEGVPISICKIYVPDQTRNDYKDNKYWSMFEIHGMGELSYCGAYGDNLTWRYNEDTRTLVIEGRGAMADYGFETNKAPWADKEFTSVVFSKELTFIGSYAFYNCKSLTNVDLSECNALEKIGKNAFAHCTSLNFINLSCCTALKRIGKSAFAYCTSLNFIVVHATKPPTIYRNTFSKVFTDIPVYVLDGSLIAYKSNRQWVRFFSNFRSLSKFGQE